MEAESSPEVQELITNQGGRISQKAITLISVVALIRQSCAVCLLVVLTVSAVFSALTLCFQSFLHIYVKRAFYTAAHSVGDSRLKRR